MTALKPLTVWITTKSKILKLMGIPDHLTCLLRNLNAGQETTVGTSHGTTGWFKFGKGVCQGCILSPCLFNLYAEYIMHHKQRHHFVDKSPSSQNYCFSSNHVQMCVLGWMKLKLELPGEISVTSNRQITSLKWQKAKRN